MTNSDISSDNVILKVNNLVAGYQRVLPIVIDVSVEVAVSYTHLTLPTTPYV